MLMLVEEPQRWRRAGWGRRSERPTRVFEALVVIPCAQCARPIRPGERFSRVEVNRKTNFRLPLCRACLPFTELPDA
jgi:hypothetical protein